jgi:glycerophosphoryl diester phosphodiesterase
MNRMITLLLPMLQILSAQSSVLRAQPVRSPTLAAQPAPRPILPTARHNPIVIAHRADHEHAPENTLAAIEDAIRCDADYVELDLRTTRDGHLVLSHDASVDRMTGSHGAVATLTLAELQQLVVRNPGAQAKDDHLPEFRDALRTCKSKINIYLDFKEADVAETWRQIKAAHMEHQVIVYLNKPGQYEQWRTIAPQVPLMTSLPDDHPTRQQVDSFLQKKKIALLDNVYDTAMQRYVRQQGITLWLDAQSDHESPATWSTLLRQDIQGLQTDHPEELIAWLSQRNATPGIYNIKNFGATGDGLALDSKAINTAIQTAADSGGGTVFIPAGNYRCGSIRLKSNIHLYIDQGATLIAAEVKAENDYDDEEPGSKTSYQDKGHSHWHNSLIWGEGLHDLEITGSGRIWGKGLYRSGVDSKQSANKAIALLNCRNVTLKDFSILHGGWFAILATGTDNLTVDNLRMDTNRDGIDVDACRNVRIANCLVNSPTDDGICLKSSYALDSARSTDNVTITNCQLSGYDEGSLLDGTYRRSPPYKDRYPTGRIKLGTESNGGFRNITISNCVFEYCNGLALESVDGALLEDITIDNITMRDVKAPLFLRLGARMRGPTGTQPGTLRRIRISNIVAYNSIALDGTATISGIPGHAIEDVSLSNIDIWYQGGGLDTLRTPVPENEKKYPEPGMFEQLPVYGLYVRHAKNITLTDVSFHFSEPDHRAPLAFDDVDGVYLRHVDAQRLPDAKPMLLNNTTHLTISK